MAVFIEVTALSRHGFGPSKMSVGVDTICDIHEPSKGEQDEARSSSEGKYSVGCMMAQSDGCYWLVESYETVKALLLAAGCTIVAKA